MKDISEFKRIHAGQDVWVVGSGATLDFIDPSFFDGKITVGLNLVYSRFKDLKYYLTYHQENVEFALKAGVWQPYIVPKFDQGRIDIGKSLLDYRLDYGKNIYYFDHEGRSIEYPRSLDPPDHLVAIGTTVATSGISFAKYLGAKNIILCGIDGGRLNSHSNFNAYDDPNRCCSDRRRSPLEEGNYMIFTPELLRVVAAIRAKGINVVSLNPFMNLTLEGHVFDYDPNWYNDPHIHDQLVVEEGRAFEMLKRSRGGRYDKATSEGAGIS